MPRSENQRLKLLYLRDYLLENTDENHTVEATDIINHLQTTHDIDVERKTIYSDIKLLGEDGYGLDIEYDAQAQGYKVREREFTLDELQLLVDSIQSSKFITAKYAKEISDKLKKFASRHDRRTLERQSYVPNRIRSMNESASSGLENIHACIAENKKLTFRYFTYTPNKEKSYLKKGGAYVASPYALVWDDNNYYLQLIYLKNKTESDRIKEWHMIKNTNNE
jgi:hypothetical protein